MLQTEDLFKGAFGLTRGGELVGIDVKGVNGRRMAVFLIEGPGMDDVEKEFQRGRSVVDLRLLKSEVARLKHLAFEALRREQRCRSRRKGSKPSSPRTRSPTSSLSAGST